MVKWYDISEGQCFPLEYYLNVLIILENFPWRTTGKFNVVLENIFNEERNKAAHNKYKLLIILA
jgi:hypothetical protein